MVLFIEVASFFEGANIIQIPRCLKSKGYNFIFHLPLTRLPKPRKNKLNINKTIESDI